MFNKLKYAVIFCGGKGTRLGTISKKINKSLLLVNNKPIIYYIVLKLLKLKIDKIIFPLGYRGNEIKKYIIKTFNNDTSKFQFINTGINSQIYKRINLIKEYLPSKGIVLFANGDTLFNFNLKQFFNSHQKSKKKVSLATFKTKIDLGLIEIKKNKPQKFEKSVFISNFKIQKKNYLAYSGFSIMDSMFIKKFKFNTKNDFEIEMYNKNIKTKNLNIYKINNGTCFPIDNIKNLNFANSRILIKV